MEEVHEVVFTMNPYKSPYPDSFEHFFSLPVHIEMLWLRMFVSSFPLVFNPTLFETLIVPIQKWIISLAYEILDLSICTMYNARSFLKF